MTVRLRHGDTLPMLREMAPGSIDCIVSDVPYSTISGGKGGSGGRPSGVLAPNDGKVFEHNEVKFSQYFHDLFRVLRDPGHCYLMVNTINLEGALAEARRTGFKLHQVLPERKQNVTPSRWYMKNVEFTLFLRKGAAFPINNPSSLMCSDWVNPVGRKTHPTEKSVALMRRYIENSTQPGETVLDPFMGTGATGVACVETNRNFVGHEMSLQYYLVACRRMRVMP